MSGWVVQTGQVVSVGQAMPTACLCLPTRSHPVLPPNCSHTPGAMYAAHDVGLAQNKFHKILYVRRAKTGSTSVLDFFGGLCDIAANASAAGGCEHSSTPALACCMPASCSLRCACAILLPPHARQQPGGSSCQCLLRHCGVMHGGASARAIDGGDPADRQLTFCVLPVHTA